MFCFGLALTATVIELNATRRFSIPLSLAQCVDYIYWVKLILKIHLHLSYKAKHAQRNMAVHHSIEPSSVCRLHIGSNLF